MRRAALVMALCLSTASSAFAGAITIEWEGAGTKWYNPDWLSLCQTTTPDHPSCEFWDGIEALGISLADPASALLKVSLTVEDALSGVGGSYSTTGQVAYQFGPLSINGATNFQLSGGGGFGSHISFPATTPLPGMTRGPQGIYLGWNNLAGFDAPAPNVPLSAFLFDQPLSALTATHCTSLGSGNCDTYGTLIPVALSVPATSVPEMNSLVLLLPAMPALMWWRRRAGRQR